MWFSVLIPSAGQMFNGYLISDDIVDKAIVVTDVLIPSAGQMFNGLFKLLTLMISTAVLIPSAGQMFNG